MRAAESVRGMRPPSINLARRPFRNNTVHYAVFGACAVLLVLATIINVREFFLRGSELTVLREQLTIGRQRYDRLFQDVETMKREISQVNLALLDDKSAFVNGLILSRLFSWSLLFDRLEELLPYDVKVRSIRPSITAKEIEIQIDGMSKSHLDFYEFEANLGNSEYFVGVYPVNESNRESKTELNFDLIMKYLPAGKLGQDPSPPTPTAGLPQPLEQDEQVEQGEQAQQEEGAGEAEPTGEDPAGAAPIPVAAAPPEGQAGGGDAGAAAQQGAAEGAPPVVTQETAPAAEPAPAESEPASPRMGPMMKMSNKEFYDQGGEPRFITVRGNMVPKTPDDQPDLSNADYIKRFGIEQFLTRRGSLTMMQQKRKPAEAP